jgi:hypothetical protein
VHLVEHVPDALGLAAAQVTLADLGPHELARAGVLEALGRCLVRFDFWHQFLLTKRLPLTLRGQSILDLRFWILDWGCAGAASPPNPIQARQSKI